MQTPSTPSPSPTWCVLRSEIPALEFASFDLKIEVILCYRAHLPPVPGGVSPTHFSMS